MKQIIACIDGSPLTEQVLNATEWLAKKTEAPITLLHALEKANSQTHDLSGTIGFSSREHLLSELTELDEKRAKLALEHGRLLLDGAQAHLQQNGVSATPLQRHGDFVATLSDLEQDARAFIVGKQGTEHCQQHVIGSNLEHAARTLSQPILVIPSEFSTPSSFMVAFDGRETSIKALEKIANSPLLKDIPCHLVMVKRDKSGQQETLDKAKSKLVDLDFNVTGHLIEGENIQSTLLSFQQQHKIDLIAMGAYAHSKVRQFFVGSNTTKMLTESTVPVLILR